MSLPTRGRADFIDGLGREGVRMVKKLMGYRGGCGANGKAVTNTHSPFSDSSNAFDLSPTNAFYPTMHFADDHPLQLGRKYPRGTQVPPRGANLTK